METFSSTIIQIFSEKEFPYNLICRVDPRKNRWIRLFALEMRICRDGEKGGDPPPQPSPMAEPLLPRLSSISLVRRANTLTILTTSVLYHSF